MTKTLEFDVFRTPNGSRTCRTKEGKCKFLLVRKFGTQPVCGFGEQEDLDIYEVTGYIKPKLDCPMWRDEK